MYGDFFKQSMGMESTLCSTALILYIMVVQTFLIMWCIGHAIIYRRRDITEQLKKLQCRTLVFVGDNSPFHSEAIHMTSKLDKRYSALVEVIRDLHICAFCDCL